MSAAGIPIDATIPKGAAEIVAICRRLPLSLGIAGRIASEMDLAQQDSWLDVVELMRDEHQRAQPVDNMIATSLKAIGGAQAEQVRLVFRALALVPEDARVPLEALIWMMEAVDDSSTVTIAQLRRMIKCLIDRSLVLGPIDKPSLHGTLIPSCCALTLTDLGYCSCASHNVSSSRRFSAMPLQISSLTSRQVCTRRMNCEARIVVSSTFSEGADRILQR